MNTIEYNVTLKGEGEDWYAGCKDPLLPGFTGKDRRGVLWNVYKVIFEDLREANDKNPFTDSLELRVNIIES